MDVHHHQYQHQHQNQYQHHYPQPYAPSESDGHQPVYDHSHSYEAYYSSYPQPQPPQYDPSAYSHHHQYYDYSASYQQPPPPPGVDHAHHPYMPAPQPDGMQAAGFSHPSEYALPLPIDGTPVNGGVSQMPVQIDPDCISNEYGVVSSANHCLSWLAEDDRKREQLDAGGGRFSFRGRGGNRGSRGGFGRGNFRGRGRGRGVGRAQEPAQRPTPKPARQPKPHARCDICRVDCNSVEILEQHKAGKRHKRTVQRIQEYEAQQKQLAGYQSTVVFSTTTSETGQSVAESLTQTVPESVAASTTAVASEAGTCNAPAKVVILEEQNKEIVGQNQPATEGPSESLKTEASRTQTPSPSEANQAEAASSGKRSFSKRPRPDGYGLGFVYGYGGGRFHRGGNRGGRFDRGGKRPRRFGEFQPWPPMAMPMVPGSGPASHLPRVRPVVCMVCNISCDTPQVFEAHVAGKKHQTHINKLQGPNDVFGPLTIYIPPGHPTPYPQNGLEPVFYGFTTPEKIKKHEMSIQEEMEDGDEEEAGGDDQQDGNPDDRAEVDGDGQDRAMPNNAPNGVMNADQSKLQNESVMGPTLGTIGGNAGDENRDTKVAPNTSDVVADLQTTSELSEVVAGEKIVG